MVNRTPWKKKTEKIYNRVDVDFYTRELGEFQVQLIACEIGKSAVRMYVYDSLLEARGHCINGEKDFEKDLEKVKTLSGAKRIATAILDKYWAEDFEKRNQFNW